MKAVESNLFKFLQGTKQFVIPIYQRTYSWSKPQKSKLRLSLNLDFEEINDPKGLCRDITDLGRWGNGNVDVGISNITELEDFMFLIKQAFKKHAELNGD